MGWTEITEEQQKIRNRYAEISDEDIKAINNLFEHYLFFKKEKDGMRISTSCCHVNDAFYPKVQRTETAEHYNLLGVKHNYSIKCPYCGRFVTAKSIGIVKGCSKLYRWKHVVIINVSKDGEEVFAKSVCVEKDFYQNYHAEPRICDSWREYHFARGHVTEFEKQTYTNEWLVSSGPWVKEPFFRGMGYHSYHVIGAERLKQSFLRYTGFERYTDRIRLTNRLMRFLAVAAIWPENIEMVMKLGLTEVVGDLLLKQKKNVSVIKWGERDPRKAFGLSKNELKEFLEMNPKNVDVLHWWKVWKRQEGNVTMQEANKILCQMTYNVDGFAKLCKEKRIKCTEAAKYLRKQEKMPDSRGYFPFWRDYLQAAEEIGYDMQHRGVLMPRNLQESHDAAVAERNRRADELDAEIREQNNQKAAERVKRLTKKYACELDGFVFRPAATADEIIAEGKALSHCVGGYAERHITGKLDILFMRPADKPDEPFYTIEMQDGKLKQIHGFRNRNVTKEDEAILNQWCAWVAAGSKRIKKTGAPVLPAPVKKEKKAS